MAQKGYHHEAVNQQDETALFSAYAQDRSVDVRNEIVEKYLYIPSIVTKHFSGRGIESDDLYQVASLALIKAVERFDQDKGVKFSSYATPTIIGEVKNYFRDRLRAIRLPRRGVEMVRLLRIAQNELEQRLFRAPTPEELAEHLDASVEEVLEAHEVASAMNSVSIDASIGEDDFSLDKVLGFDESGYEVFEKRETINSLVALLSDMEREVIRQRYFGGLSQRDLARKMDVSQMTISRIERRAIDKMKESI